MMGHHMSRLAHAVPLVRNWSAHQIAGGLNSLSYSGRLDVARLDRMGETRPGTELRQFRKCLGRHDFEPLFSEDAGRGITRHGFGRARDGAYIVSTSHDGALEKARFCRRVEIPRSGDVGEAGCLAGDRSGRDGYVEAFDVEWALHALMELAAAAAGRALPYWWGLGADGRPLPYRYPWIRNHRGLPESRHSVLPIHDTFEKDYDFVLRTAERANRRRAALSPEWRDRFDVDGTRRLCDAVALVETRS